MPRPPCGAAPGPTPASLSWGDSGTGGSNAKVSISNFSISQYSDSKVTSVRAKLLVLASSIAMLGWGTVLPYQYAYAANTRGWGALAAALASTLFSVGALVAAPFAGRLSDRFNPVAVAVLAKVLAAVGVGGLIWA